MAASSSIDLEEVIEKAKTFCLNEKRTKPHENVFIPGECRSVWLLLTFAHSRPVF